jgi:hypothetical protein
MRVLWMPAQSGRWRTLNIHNVDSLSEIAAMMRCVVQQIDISYIDPDHVILQCTAYPDRSNYSFFVRDWDYCSVGGDACVVRVDGRDIDPNYDPFWMRRCTPFSIYERTDLSWQVEQYERKIAEQERLKNLRARLKLWKPPRNPMSRRRMRSATLCEPFQNSLFSAPFYDEDDLEPVYYSDEDA